MIAGTLKGCETSWIPFGQELAPLQGASRLPRLPEVFARSDLRLLSNNPAGLQNMDLRLL